MVDSEEVEEGVGEEVVGLVAGGVPGEPLSAGCLVEAEVAAQGDDFMVGAGECFGVAGDHVVDEVVSALFDDDADVGVGDVVAVAGGGQPGAAVSVEEVEPVVDVRSDAIG